jgi:hypothetical protein
LSEPLPPELPGSARVLAEAVGLPTLLKLVEKYGGTYLNLPESGIPTEELVSQLGPEAAKAITWHARGGTIEVPRCLGLIRATRNRQIRTDRAAGLTLARLARKHQLTLRQISNILDEEDSDTGQSSLF